MLKVRTLQVDVPAPAFEQALAFWSGALSATPRQAAGPFTHLDGATAALAVHLQRLDDGEPRYHLDLEADDIDAEAQRLIGLGAREVGRNSLAGPDATFHWWVLEDPAGLPLCVVPDDSAPPLLSARRSGTGYLDAVFVDVPEDVVETDIAFWSAALGAPVESPDDPHSPYTSLDAVHGPGGRLYAEVQRVGARARYHVDLAAADVEGEARRLESLGGRRVAEIETWITLADPAGNLLCVVPDSEDR